MTQLAGLDRDVTNAERVSRLRVLEQIGCAVAAAQARDAVDLDRTRRTERAAAGVPAARQGEGVAAELALARRVSPHRAARLLGLATILDREMPRTFALMQAGELTEWRATLLVRETACLALADRRTVDTRLCGGDTPAVLGMGDRQVEAAVRRLAVELDVAAVAERAAKAPAQRRVSLRPAPDTMAYVTALLPVADAVSLYASLRAAATSAVAAGDGRGLGQVMADTLVARCTGRDPHEGPCDLALQVVLTDATLLAQDNTPGHLPGVGPVPAPWVRQLVHDASVDATTRVFVRQLYAGPHGGLVALSSQARCAPDGLAALVRLRDDSCRTPWCDAPIRQVDHIQPWADDGPTTAHNLQGLCERCNHARQAPGWQGRSHPGSDPHVVTLTTPTGHSYAATAPPVPAARRGSVLEEAVLELLQAA